MNRQSIRKVLILSFTAVFSGCSTSWYVSAEHPESDKPKEIGYGYAMRQSNLPDTAAHCRLIYTSSAGTHGLNRRTVWPTLLSGYYGADIVHDEIIIFGVDLRVAAASHISNLLAAKGGPPAVDITKAVLKGVHKSRQDIQSLDLSYYTMKKTDSGVTMQLQRWMEEQRRSESLEVTFSWQEIADLVTRLRASGTPHKFKGIRYYAED